MQENLQYLKIMEEICDLSLQKMSISCIMNLEIISGSSLESDKLCVLINQMTSKGVTYMKKLRTVGRIRAVK